MRSKGFTITELLAVLIVIGVLLAITIPSMTKTLDDMKINSFRINTLGILSTIDNRRMKDKTFTGTSITNGTTLKSTLDIDGANYGQIIVAVVGDETNIKVTGVGKWDGLVACGNDINLIVGSLDECQSFDPSKDNTSPTIMILGNPSITMEAGSTYVDAGATAFDNVDGDITSKITTTTTLDMNVASTYAIAYTVSDAAGNTTTVYRKITVHDSNAPIVAFGTNGNSTYAKTRSTTVTATATIGLDASSLKYLWTTSAIAPTEGSFSSSFTNGGTITSPPGVTGGYYLWILAKNTLGVTAMVCSNVFNMDNTAPTVTFGTNGNVTYAKTRSTTVMVTDNVNIDDSSLKYQWTTSAIAPTEGSFSSTFTNGGTITSPFGVAGGYYLWILAKDISGNTAITNSNVFNIDDLAPVVTMNGTNPTLINIHSTYMDAGATAFDSIDGAIAVSSASTVNTNLAGMYTVTYTVSDAMGNIATSVRTVNVIEIVDVLAVAGGGGGGWGCGGGGGAGGVAYVTNFRIPLKSYTVTVGGGGIGSTGDAARATNGGDSVFSTITAVGGGAGGWAGGPGINGGSGGGAGYVGGMAGGVAASGQGYNGGAGKGVAYRGAGGGGAGGPGADADVSGNGGPGIANSISGSTIYYGGGGGGGEIYQSGATGGSGGGGVGGIWNIQAYMIGGNGAANTGGGGGGGANVSNGGAGGSGIVIIRYLGAQKATGGAVTSSGGYTIHTFYSSSTFTMW